MLFQLHPMFPYGASQLHPARGGWDVHVPHCLRGSHAHGCRVQAGSTWETTTQHLMIGGSNGEQPYLFFIGMGNGD